MLRMEDIPGEAFWYSACERGVISKKVSWSGSQSTATRMLHPKTCRIGIRELSDDGEIRSYKQGKGQDGNTVVRMSGEWQSQVAFIECLLFTNYYTRLI